MLQIMKFVSQAGTGSFITRMVDPKKVRLWASAKGVAKFSIRRYDPKTRRHELFQVDGKA